MGAQQEQRQSQRGGACMTFIRESQGRGLVGVDAKLGTGGAEIKPSIP